MALHYGRDDFKDQDKLVRTLSRERAKDMATDYAKADPARSFAERRGITFRERVAEIVRQAPEKARGMFDGLRLAIGEQDRGAPAAPERQRGIFADFKPLAPAADPARAAQTDREPVPRLAAERTARPLLDLRTMRDQAHPLLPHHRPELDNARDALDRARRARAGAMGDAQTRTRA